MGMTHAEFMAEVLGRLDECGLDSSAIPRLAAEGALVPASWCRGILKAVPGAREYLKRRCPEAMRLLNEAEARRREAAGR